MVVYPMTRGLNHKDALCSGTSRLSLCSAALVVAVFAALFIAVLQLSTESELGRGMRCILVALGVSCLLEVVRSYWTDRHWPGTAAGTLRFFALWLGMGLLLYAVPVPFEFLSKSGSSPNSSGGAGFDSLSVVTAVLSAVLAVTTLVATKVAADAKAEVLNVKADMSETVREFTATYAAAEFNSVLQRLLAWRFEIEAALPQCSQAQAAELFALQKMIKALKGPMELAHHWGGSALDNLKLTHRAIQADTLLQATPDLSKSVALVLGHSGGENQLRELGKALGHFLDVLRSRHPRSSASEDASWEALAQLARRLERI